MGNAWTHRSSDSIKCAMENWPALRCSTLTLWRSLTSWFGRVNQTPWRLIADVRCSRRDGHIQARVQEEARDMAAYIIGLRRSAPRETAWLKEYLPKTAALIAKHGGKPLIGGNTTPRLLALEGAGEPPLGVVVLEFPSLEQAQAWHDDPDYAPLKQMRQANLDMEICDATLRGCLSQARRCRRFSFSGVGPVWPVGTTGHNECRLGRLQALHRLHWSAQPVGAGRTRPTTRVVRDRRRDGPRIRADPRIGNALRRAGQWGAPEFVRVGHDGGHGSEVRTQLLGVRRLSRRIRSRDGRLISVEPGRTARAPQAPMRGDRTKRSLTRNRGGVGCLRKTRSSSSMSSVSSSIVTRNAPIRDQCSSSAIRRSSFTGRRLCPTGERGEALRAAARRGKRSGVLCSRPTPSGGWTLARWRRAERKSWSCGISGGSAGPASDSKAKCWASMKSTRTSWLARECSISIRRLWSISWAARMAPCVPGSRLS